MPPRLPRPPASDAAAERLARARGVLSNAERDAARHPAGRRNPEAGSPAANAGRRKPEAGSPKAKAEPTALDRALRLLGARARTAQELDRKLAQAQVPQEERAAALSRVRELGYIDDAQVARTRAQRLLQRGDAPRLVARKLQAQGISGAEAKVAAQEAASGQDGAGLAQVALQKKLRGRPVKDERERMRLFRSLVQKGHEPKDVARALKLAWEGEE